ncbi:T9SS-dependent choice-of-anchor J family protein [Cyclobacterium amurskyense]|uniref:Ulilysin n=1 Tax=Cyclobacterium amurskyense TaxID=320787 RepID=A0A0H4PE25_9BACT|nr:choice-of-anchor J domain-containing protein [Cyclobacterium amurskyense]AKP52721.1 Ulilysin [Cyclobacterium amurskyense]
MVNKYNALILNLVSVLFLFLSIIQLSIGQGATPTADVDNSIDQCGTVFFEKKQAQAMGYFGTRQYFESWVDTKGVEMKQNAQGNRTLANEKRRLPVVVHVIHHGEAIGVGANISEAQILDQIRILNEDFQMQNPDFAANTPSEFLDVAANAGIEFVLAKQDPQGMSSSGINRVLGPKETYGLNDAALIGQLASWDPEEYINIWVLPLTPPTIGFAGFPVSNELEGLNNPSPTPETDGVTIDYNYFGSIGTAVQNSRGRTATHEMGHFFGLRHIWGDGGCEVDDYVTDTPLQSQSNNTCIVTPRFTCDSRDMVENFMDYTPDRCMSLFTEGQVERMDVILNFSPRRASLPTSRALFEPQLFDSDIELLEIVSPSVYICDYSFTPIIEVVNKGKDPVNKVRASIKANGLELETKDFDVSIAPGETLELEFDVVTLNAESTVFTAEVLLVNGFEDDDTSNNRRSVTTALPVSQTLPYAYPGHVEASGWEYINGDQGFTWTPVNLQLDNARQEAFLLNGFDYNGQGELDYLVSPVFDLSGIPNPQLSFDLAYSPFSNSAFTETLIVAVSTDCGNTFNLLTAPYNKSGATLATLGGSLNEFFPSSEQQFRKELVNLSAYAGQDNVRIAFVSINGYGNNIYLKNIAINTEETYRYQLGINEVTQPLPVVNGDQILDKLSIDNTGNLPVSSFYVSNSINGLVNESSLFNAITLDANASTSVDLANGFDPGLNEVVYQVSSPNFDQNFGAGDELTSYFIQDDSKILVPWRQDFDSGLGDWISINPENDFSSWQLNPSSGGNSSNQMVLDDMVSNNSYWLVSPEFSLAETGRAGLFFDWGGTGFSSGSQTSFSLIVSKDGGQTGQSLWEMSGEALNKDIDASDDPTLGTFVNLNDFAREEKVRLYFKVNNLNDSDALLFLDNISLYLSDDPDPVVPELNQSLVYPNPAIDNFHISFNLENYQDVKIEFFSLAGQKAYDVSFPNTLNQTYTFGKMHLGTGLFVVKITGENFMLTKKLVVY